MEYCTVKDGRLVRKQTLMEGGEGLNTPHPRYGRFHSPDGTRLPVVFAATEPDGTWFNAVMPLLPQRGEPTRIPLREPFTAFFTACERGGSRPTKTLDIFGVGVHSPNSLRYAALILP